VYYVQSRCMFSTFTAANWRLMCHAPSRWMSAALNVFRNSAETIRGQYIMYAWRCWPSVRILENNVIYRYFTAIAVHPPRTTAIYRACICLIDLLDLIPWRRWRISALWQLHFRNCRLHVWLQCSIGCLSACYLDGAYSEILMSCLCNAYGCWTYDLSIGLMVVGATPISLSNQPGQLTETIQVLVKM